MFMEYGVAIALIGVATLIYADYIKIPRTRANALAWGIPIGLVAVGLLMAYSSRTQTPNSWETPGILRLTSRPIGA